MEEDDRLRALFSDFQPEISSDFAFMSRLERSMNSVELVKRHAVECKCRNRRAVGIAAVVGFVAGFLFSLLLPALQNAVEAWQLKLPESSWLNPIADNCMTAGWIAVVGASALIALNAYELSLSVLKTGEFHDHI